MSNVKLRWIALSVFIFCHLQPNAKHVSHKHKCNRTFSALSLSTTGSMAVGLCKVCDLTAVTFLGTQAVAMVTSSSSYKPYNFVLLLGFILTECLSTLRLIILNKLHNNTLACMP
jgi:hypothetical protein